MQTTSQLWRKESPARQRCPRACRQTNAFTLIEVVGVLAILTILGALALPAVIRQIDHAKLVREGVDLNTCAEALTRSIVRTKTVPLLSDIPTAMAKESALNIDQITSTEIGTRRGIVIDPALRIGPGLPYTQAGNLGLSSPPVSARLTLLSSLVRSNPLGSDETNSTAANFSAIWSTPQNSKPFTWVNWRGSGEDLRIQRLDLASLFHRLILVNHDPDHQPRFSIDVSGLLSDAPTNNVWDAYYLDGTVVGLYVGNLLQTRHVLTSDISFVFENGLWSGMIGRGAPPAGLPDTFARTADQFFGAPWNSGARQGASQLPVLLAMSALMQAYSSWANGCPHFAYHGNPGNPGNVPEYRLIEIYGGRNQLLDEFTGPSGLLK
jgi:type II secretory pathway pseudopilin PulG